MPEANPPLEDEDDALAEFVADMLVELACRPGLLRLAALQMAGLLPESGLDDSTLAQALGCNPKTIYRTRCNALEKLALKPEVLAMARAAAPSPES